jgi:hypothetical protein
MENRKHSRANCSASARIRYGLTEFTGQVLNLSTRGVLIEIETGLAIPPESVLEIALLISDGASASPVHFKGKLIRIEDRRMGLRIINIDLDSYVRLKRLVEFNLGKENGIPDEHSTHAE